MEQILLYLCERKQKDNKRIGVERLQQGAGRNKMRILEKLNEEKNEKQFLFLDNACLSRIDDDGMYKKQEQ